MKKDHVRYWKFGIVALAIILASYFLWWRHAFDQVQHLSGMDTKASIVKSSANKAKAKMAKFTMRSAGMSITGISGDKIEVLNTVVIKTPLPINLNLTGLDYAFTINTVKAAEGSYGKPISIPASGSKTITLPMVVSAKAIDAVNDQLEAKGKDSANYSFLHTVHTKVPIAGERKFEIAIHEMLPMIFLPKLKPGDIDIKKFSLKNAGINLTLKVTNPNSFDIRMKNGSYSMTIDGKHTMHGTMQEVVQLPAKSTVLVSMHLSAKTGRALKMGWKMLMDKKDTKYSLQFDGTILSNEKMLRNSKMHFSEDGTLDELVKALKNQ